MALMQIIETQGQSSVQTPIGVIDNGVQKISFNAYISVVSVNGNKSQVTATVKFKGKSEQFYNQYTVPVYVGENSKNFIAQVYEYLKTLPEFAGATDC
tara:strand:+ start:836 stop:1129 length:294 start_codon:yes stop_codon:yes gene_type:complete